MSGWYRPGFAQHLVYRVAEYSRLTSWGGVHVHDGVCLNWFNLHFISEVVAGRELWNVEVGQWWDDVMICLDDISLVSCYPTTRGVRGMRHGTSMPPIKGKGRAARVKTVQPRSEQQVIQRLRTPTTTSHHNYPPHWSKRRSPV